jgi:hypothetical protein
MGWQARDVIAGFGRGLPIGNPFGHDHHDAAQALPLLLIAQRVQILGIRSRPTVADLDPAMIFVDRFGILVRGLLLVLIRLMSR